MTARTAQFLIASVFLILGGWALFAPASVIELAFTEAYRDSTYLTRFTMACFGSQAVLFGVMALVTRWEARSFAVFAAVLLPFFVFDWYFHVRVPVLNSVGMLDLVGNVTMLALAILGWRAARAEERA